MYEEKGGYLQNSLPHFCCLDNQSIILRSMFDVNQVISTRKQVQLVYASIECSFKVGLEGFLSAERIFDCTKNYHIKKRFFSIVILISHALHLAKEVTFYLTNLFLLQAVNMHKHVPAQPISHLDVSSIKLFSHIVMVSHWQGQGCSYRNALDVTFCGCQGQVRVHHYVGHRLHL